MKALSFVAGLFLLVAGCGGGGGGSSPALNDTGAAVGPWSLQATSETELTAHFREALGKASSFDFTGNLGQPGLLPAPAFSRTTLQEAGVDEADLIKSDGAHVFSLDPGENGVRNVLRRQRLDTTLTPRDSLQVPFSSGVQGTGLYLDGERAQLAALGELSYNYGVFDNWFWPPAWSSGATEVSLVSSADTASMQVRRKLHIGARLIGSRRIASTLYLVVRSSPSVPGLLPSWQPGAAEANALLLQSLQVSQLLPTVSIDGGQAQPLVAPSSCLMQSGNSARSPDVITVVAIDLASATHRHAARCFVGGTEAFYMSDRSIYLATSRYGSAGGAPGWGTSTDIHKFELDGVGVAYRGSGNVAGYLGSDRSRNSFRMGEHDGALRVVTQDPRATQSPARLSVLKEVAGTLEVVGAIPNAARPQPIGKPGEQVYATRFIGTRGYVVTFRSIDPLYVLDLSNPADPKVAGELEVNGYSDYLFPLSETLLLGVGKDAIPATEGGDGRFAWYQGVQVSLIDVSNPAHPQELARQVIGRRGTDATVLGTHHGIALMRSGDNVRISMPVRLHDVPVPNTGDHPSVFFDTNRTELQRFEVNLPARTLTARPPLVSQSSGWTWIGNDRSLLWNDTVHWYQNGTWTSAGW